MIAEIGPKDDDGELCWTCNTDNFDNKKTEDRSNAR